jgi:hypothetical protein
MNDAALPPGGQLLRRFGEDTPEAPPQPPPRRSASESHLENVGSEIPLRIGGAGRGRRTASGSQRNAAGGLVDRTASAERGDDAIPRIDRRLERIGVRRVHGDDGEVGGASGRNPAR